uniref:Sfi1 spindle body domain-containing protein n=1 Tax=Picocystis salinarum TaxID=88271 RepID=A0A7S3UCA5_9CHLO
MSGNKENCAAVSNEGSSLKAAASPSESTKQRPREDAAEMLSPKAQFSSRKSPSQVLSCRMEEQTNSLKESDALHKLGHDAKLGQPSTTEMLEGAKQSVALDPNECLTSIPDGTIVALLKDGIPFTVKEPKVALRETGQAAPKEYVLSDAEDIDIFSNAWTHLTVVRHGNWYGFRAGVANGKFLQVRKKGLNRLCFFSAKFGIWEQWELVPPDDGSDNSNGSNEYPVKVAMTFRSRRLPSFVLRVQVVLIPEEYQEKSMITSGFEISESCPVTPDRSSYGTSTPASPALSLPDRIQMHGGRRPVPHSSNAQQGHPMAAMSGILIKEWSSFVMKEVRARQDVTKTVATMRNEFAEAVQRISEETEAIRKEAEEANSELLKKQIQSWRKRSTVRALLSAFKVWRGLVDDRKAEVQYEQSVQAYSKKQSAFQSWLRYTMYLKHARKCAEEMSNRRNSFVIASSFLAWSSIAEDRRAADVTLAERLEVYWMEKRRQRAIRLLHDWSSQAKHLSILTYREEMIRKKRQLKSIANSFHLWQGLYTQEKFLRRNEGLISSKVAGNLLCKAFYGWKQTQLEHALTRSKLRKFATMRHERNMALAFFAWRDRLLVEKALQKNRKKNDTVLLQKSLNALHELAEDQKQLEKTANFLARKHTLEMKQDFFAAWKYSWERSKNIESKLSQIRQKQELQLQHSALVVWFQSAAKKRCLQQKMCAHRTAISLRSVSIIFSKWRKIAIDAQLKNECADQMVEQKQTQFYKNILAEWRDSALLDSSFMEQTCIASGKQKSSRLKSSAFQMWRNITEYEKEMTGLADVMSNTLQRTQCRVQLLGWLDYAKKKRAMKVAEERIRAKCKRSALTSVWISWRQHVADEFAREAKIKSCIRSKRVLKDWFVNWYWDAYEDEIRSTLKLLYGTTEEVLGQLYDMYEEMSPTELQPKPSPTLEKGDGARQHVQPPGSEFGFGQVKTSGDLAEEFTTPALIYDDVEEGNGIRRSPRKELSFQ